MKRILSLVLVLVMVLGVMPMASAEGTPCVHKDTENVTSKVTTPATCTTAGVTTYTCSAENCGATWTTPIEALNHKNVSEWTPVEGEEATCVDSGKEYGYCPDCETAVTRTVQANGKHTYDETITENVTVIAPNCKEAGKKIVKCKFCAAVKETAGDPATGAHHYDANGNCDNKLQDGTSVCGHKRTATLTAADISVKVGATAQIAPVLNPANAAVTYTYATGNAAIATVSASGLVTGVEKGETTITITASTGETGTCDVTVTDGVVLACDSIETTSNSATLTPYLRINGVVDPTATFTFSGTGVKAAADGKSATVTSSKNEIVKVVVSVKSYDGATSADLAKVPAIDTYVSFYSYVGATVNVKDGTNSFAFTESGVFSSVYIDDVKQSAPNVYSMVRLWANSADYYGILLEQDDAKSDVGSITYTSLGAYQFDPSKPNSYNLNNIEFLQFNCKKEGTFKLIYTLMDDDTGLIVQAGTIKINVGDVDGDITYKTAFKKNLVLDEDDFAAYWAKAKMKSKLDYVVFDNQPALGALKTDNTSSAKTVSSTMTFYYQHVASDKNYDLDDVVYIPYSKATQAYKDTVTFTCVGETKSETVTGVLEISVGEELNFTDVKKTDYFYEAVEWAVAEGITAGTSATTFAPNATCTRAQVVTFLYRAAGEPKVSGSLPFTDVKTTDYYYDAVLWAYQEDITTGLTAKTFGPNATVTRGQVVTFLSRALDGEPSGNSNPFTDVKKSDYFYEAVLWAVEEEVTTGMTAKTFGPNSGCTRGQIVTFLYRAYEGE